MADEKTEHCNLTKQFVANADFHYIATLYLEDSQLNLSSQKKLRQMKAGQNKNMKYLQRPEVVCRVELVD